MSNGNSSLLEDHFWLKEHALSFAGLWIALKSGALMAVANSLCDLEAILKGKGLTLEDVFFLQIGTDFKKENS